MKKIPVLITLALILSSTVLAQTGVFTTRAELNGDYGIPGLAAGDRFDLTFTLDFSATDQAFDLNTFNLSDGGGIPATVSVNRVAGNAGYFDPGAAVFTTGYFTAFSGFTNDSLNLHFDANLANSPTTGYTFKSFDFVYRTFVNLDTVQDAPAENSTLATFLGGPSLDLSVFELSFGFFTFGPSNINTTINAVPAAIPEPSTYVALAGAAALGLAVCRRRNRRGAGSARCSGGL